MTNEEIRIKIAQAKGWNVWHRTYHIRQDRFAHDTEIKELVYGDAINYRVVPRWPVNIADAWELVEEAQAEPHEQTFEIVHTPAISDKWKVTIGTAFSAAATAPRAICAAWLSWDAARKAEK